MIKVLTGWEEAIGCYRFFVNKKLPHHKWFEKNWDNFQVYTHLSNLGKYEDISVLELGYAGMSIYSLCKAMGIGHYVGVDLKRNRDDLVRSYIDWLKGRVCTRYRLIKGDMLDQKFNEEFDLVICDSAVEHGINLRDFFLACSKYVKRDGFLFITFDYCTPKIDMASTKKVMVGGKWNIFSRDEVMDMIEVAKRNGFRLVDDTSKSLLVGNSPSVIDFAGATYTFASIFFVKKS